MVGFFGSLIIGVNNLFQWITIDPAVYGTILAAAGIAIGFLNISKEEQVPTMLASLTFLVSAVGLANLPMFGTAVHTIFTPMVFAFIPIAVITAFNVAKEKFK